MDCTRIALGSNVKEHSRAVCTLAPCTLARARGSKLCTWLEAQASSWWIVWGASSGRQGGAGTITERSCLPSPSSILSMKSCDLISWWNSSIVVHPLKPHAKRVPGSFEVTWRLCLNEYFLEFFLRFLAASPPNSSDSRYTSGTTIHAFRREAATDGPERSTMPLSARN